MVLGSPPISRAVSLFLPCNLPPSNSDSPCPSPQLLPPCCIHGPDCAGQPTEVESAACLSDGLMVPLSTISSKACMCRTPFFLKTDILACRYTLCNHFSVVHLLIFPSVWSWIGSLFTLKATESGPATISQRKVCCPCHQRQISPLPAPSPLTGNVSTVCFQTSPQAHISFPRCLAGNPFGADRSSHI